MMNPIATSAFVSVSERKTMPIFDEEAGWEVHGHAARDVHQRRVRPVSGKRAAVVIAHGIACKRRIRGYCAGIKKG
jgi:hypothetical protein